MRRPVLITLAAIGGVILAAALAAPASALTRFVACDQGDNLQEAVDAATAGDVLVLTGHCEHVWIDKSLTIQGFFTSTPIIGPGFAGGPAVYVSGGTVVLENLEIEPNRIGGFGHMGMIVVGGAVTARHVLIDRGHAMGFSGWEPVGGGLRVDAGAAVTMEDSTIQFGRASDAGGGVYNAGSLTLRRTTVKSSLSTNREGGGIHNAGDALLEDSTISGNVHHRLGGGIYNVGSLHAAGVIRCPSGIRLSAAVVSWAHVRDQRHLVLLERGDGEVVRDVPGGGGRDRDARIRRDHRRTRSIAAFHSLRNAVERGIRGGASTTRW